MKKQVIKTTKTPVAKQGFGIFIKCDVAKEQKHKDESTLDSRAVKRPGNPGTRRGPGNEMDLGLAKHIRPRAE